VFKHNYLFRSKRVFNKISINKKIKIKVKIEITQKIIQISILNNFFPVYSNTYSQFKIKLFLQK